MTSTQRDDDDKINRDIEVEQLKGSNHRLQSTIQAMKLEICYYQGEVKRVETEKNKLKEDVTRMSDLFKTWLHELKSTTRSIIDDSNFVKTLVKYPAQHISSILKLSNDMTIVTTAQAPFYVEYASKVWSQECGWCAHEVLGHTCSFLQGEGTDLKTAAAFTKDVRETGYGHMRIHNYRKNGEIFGCNVTVFPVYDTVVGVGPNSDEPILTHFAAILSNITQVSSQSTPVNKNSPNDSFSNSPTYSMNENDDNAKQGANTSAAMKDSSRVLCVNVHDNNDGSNGLFKKFDKWGGGDLDERNMDATRRSNSSSRSSEDSGDSSEHEGTSDENNSSDNDKSIATEREKEKESFFKTIFADKTLSKENFTKLTTSSRLSDVLRLIVIIKDALILTDNQGRVLQVNKSFVDLKLTDTEAKFMEAVALPDFKDAPLNVITVDNSTLNVVPIRGGYMTNEVTHYFAICLPEDATKKRKYDEGAEE